ncbi:hypothetical protein DB347_12805 [Opitutaceae bacterium EW11]|nr:hypothetical protein DB347_12805 [Opitutaceae bacterium EW11]
MKTSTKISLLASVLLLSLPAAFAQSNNANTHRPDPGVPANAGKGSAESDAVRALIKEFETKREQYISDRKALIARLQGATADERKQILEQLRTEQQSRIEEQRALAKQIREELKTLRQQRKSGNGG